MKHMNPEQSQSKALEKTLWLFGLSLGVLFLTIACSSKKQANSASTPTYCAQGSVNTQYGCLPVHTCTGGYGYHHTQGCVPPVTGVGGIIPTNPTGLTWKGVMNIADSGLYKDFLEDFRFCGTTYQIGLYPGLFIGGTHVSCHTLDDYAEIHFSATSTTLPASGSAQLVVFHTNNSVIGSGWPIRFGDKVYPQNNNSGFNIRGNGFYGTSAFNKSLKVVADPGALTSNQNSVQVFYDNRLIGTAELDRY